METVALPQALENEIMRRFYVVAILAAMILGCKQEEDHPPEAPASQSEQMFLGEPLKHWTQLAEEAQTDEELGGALDALVLAIKDANIMAVVTAADTIEAIGAKGAPAAAALASRLDDPQPWVRMACMHALQAIGEPAVPVLLETFRTDAGGAAVRSVVVLGGIGPAAKAAVSELRRDLQEGPQARRSWVEEALAKIEGTDTDASVTNGAVADNNVALPLAAPIAAKNHDWPQFLGPHRDNLCRETELRTDWDQNPPTLFWKLEGLGAAYSSVAITGGRILTMGDRQDTHGDSSQFVLAFDLETRKELWAIPIGPPHKDGPRSTPTVDGDLLYALGADGDLVCLETATGAHRWRKNLVDDFDGTVMSRWKFSESPLVDRDKLICTPGGPEATLVALDKKTGAVIWKCAVPALGEKGKDGAGYASAVPTEINGVRQYVQLTGRGVVGVEAETGKFLWGYNEIANGTANIPTPIVRGPYVFATTNYNTGSALLEIARVGDTFHVKELYRLTAEQFENHHGGIVSVGNYVYGGHGNSRGEPTCVDVSTGKIMWRGEAPERGSASILYADGHILFRYDRGLVALVEATPEAFRLRGTFQPVVGSGPAWARPVIADGRLYLRHGDLLACYDMRSQQ